MEFDKIIGYVKHHKTGSNYICNPPVSDTDVDYLVFTWDKSNYLFQCAKNGWDVHSDDDYPENDDFCSVRNGNINLIVTECEWFYGRLVTATECAKKLNLLDKADRVSLFQGILYGNTSA